MDNEYQIYKTKVWDFLDSMQAGDAYLIEKLATPDTQKKFVICVKSYMDTKTPFQGYITFNRDYSKIYKTDEITFKPESNDKAKPE